MTQFTIHKQTTGRSQTTHYEYLNRWGELGRNTQVTKDNLYLNMIQKAI